MMRIVPPHRGQVRGSTSYNIHPRASPGNSASRVNEVISPGFPLSDLLDPQHLTITRVSGLIIYVINRFLSGDAEADETRHVFPGLLFTFPLFRILSPAPRTSPLTGDFQPWGRGCCPPYLYVGKGVTRSPLHSLRSLMRSFYRQP